MCQCGYTHYSVRARPEDLLGFYPQAPEILQHQTTNLLSLHPSLRLSNDTSGWGSTPKHLSKILTADQNYSKFLDL